MRQHLVRCPFRLLHLAAEVLLNFRYRRILAHFDGRIRSPDVDFRPPQLAHVIPIVGFSATFSRHDGLALGSVFQRIVYHRDFLDMMKDQWCVFTSITLRQFDIKCEKAMQRQIHVRESAAKSLRCHNQHQEWRIQSNEPCSRCQHGCREPSGRAGLA